MEREHTNTDTAGSHLAGGGWIEIFICGTGYVSQFRPTSQEVGGLKFDALQETGILPKSHLAGGGWIEILPPCPACSPPIRPTSQEVGGLKCFRPDRLALLL